MKQPSTEFSYGFGLDSYNGNPGAIGLNMNRAGFGRVGYAARTPLTPHVWHHVAATYDRTANEVRFYLDGSLDGTFTGVTGNVVPDGHPLWIGNNSANERFNGSIAELCLFHRTLSAADISALYNGGRGLYGNVGPSAYRGLAAAYHLDEGRGTTVHDFSGNGNTGRLIGGETWVHGAALPRTLGPDPEYRVPTALQFDGTGYVNIPGKSFRNLESGTISVWVRPAARAGTIISSLHDKSSDRQFPLYTWDHEDGTFSVALTAVSKDGRFVLQLDSDDRFPLDTWHHVVYSSLHGSGTFQLYVNGQPRHMYVHESWSQPTADFFFADVLQSADDLQLGGKSDSHNAHFADGQGSHGAMRDLLIFDQAFSQQQAAALHRAGPGGDLSHYAWMRSLVAGYHLDEGRGTTAHDFSGHGNDGTLHDGATWGPDPGYWVPRAAAANVPGVPANALRLDGRSGHIDVPPTREDLNMGGSSLTMAIWIKPSRSYDGEQILIEHGIGLSAQSNYLYQATTIGSNTLRFNFPAMQGDNWGWLDAAVNLADGNWHFVAATFDNGLHLAKLYDNGVLLKSKRVLESIAADEGPTHTYVGCRGNGTACFNGDIGALLIYRRAISAEQIAKLYAEAGGICDSQDKAGLAAAYYFDEGRGTTVRDFSGHGNDGTLQGGVEWVSGAAGPHARALQFDGTGYVSIPGKSFRNLQSGTISVWIRPAGGDSFVVSSLHDTSNDRQFYPSILDQGDGTFAVGVVGVTKDGHFDMAANTDNHFSLNAWHHLVYSSLHGSGTFHLYVDGKLQHMHVTSFGRIEDFFFSDVMRGSDDLQVGAKSDSHAAHRNLFHGAMRDLMIFDGPFSQAQVTALREAGGHHVPMVNGDLSRYAWMRGLVAGYHFDEVRGTTARDFSGHGNDGTLHGGLTWVQRQRAASQDAQPRNLHGPALRPRPRRPRQQATHHRRDLRLLLVSVRRIHGPDGPAARSEDRTAGGCFRCDQPFGRSGQRPADGELQQSRPAALLLRDGPLHPHGLDARGPHLQRKGSRRSRQLCGLRQRPIDRTHDLGRRRRAYDQQQPRFRLLRLDDKHGTPRPAGEARPKRPGPG